MKKRAVLTHAILALGGLTLAYLVWTEEAVEVSPDEVTLLDCDVDTLTGVTLELSGQTTRLVVEREGDTTSTLFTVTRDSDEDGAPPARFVGNPGALTFLEQIAPLRARRSLGALTDAQRAELGLDTPEGTLTLVCGDREAAFSLGEGPFGEGDRYAESTEGGDVVLLSSANLLPLQSASAQLMQRALHTFDWSEVEEMTLRGFGVDKRLRQRNRREAARAEWVDAADPDRRNELYGNWFAGYARMRLQAYLSGGTEPGADLDGTSAEREPILRAEMFDEEGARIGQLELVRIAAPTPAYYARTETTRGWVRLPTSGAETFTENLRPVLGLEPEVRDVPEPAIEVAPSDGPDAATASPDAGPE
ncbi:MAG: DUF4340 domain-containing protein [Sandaracinaceae bacterium]